MRLALRALLVAVVAAVATQSGAAAPGRSPLVTTPYSAVFWNGRVGVVGVARCRSTMYPCGRGAVELTTDGGRTFHVVLRNATPVTRVQTLGPTDAIALVHGHAWRTLDRGRTWHRWDEHPGPSAEIAYDSWPTARDGFATFLGAHGHVSLLVTRDGARSWERRRGPCSAFGTALLDFPTPRLGWLVCGGEPGAGNEDKAIYRTRNAGRTWEAGAATVRSRHHEHGGISEYGYPAGLAFASGGWGLLIESRGTLYVTRDGGKRFHAEPKVARPEVDFAGSAAAFRGGTGYVLFVAGPNPRLIETHDFGRTWHVVHRWRR